MHITCVICSDLFTPNADIYTTPCGHIFHYTCLLHWLENSKTCPQCRTKISSKSLLRLYVNVATSRGADVDITILQHKLDSAEFTMKLKNTEIKNIAEKNREIEEKNKALRLKIKELELSENRFESVVAAYKDQIKFFKSKVQNCDKLQLEITRLKNELRNLENVQTALNGSRQQVDDIIRNENSIESLALLAATLKKSLVDTDRKKKELQFGLKKTQNELSQHKRKMEQMKCEYEDTKRQLESLKLSYENEVSFLKDKFRQLQAKASQSGLNPSLNDSIRRITSESPVNYNRTPVLSGHNEEFIDLNDTNDDTPPCSGNTISPCLAISSSALDNKIVDLNLVDDSPLPASSMGMFGIQRAKQFKPHTDMNKFSIFKHKPLAPLESTVIRPSSCKLSDVTYDGLGGSSKEDIYPTPNGIKRPRTTKMSSSKFKKLSAEAGKTSKKVTDFINLT